MRLLWQLFQGRIVQTIFLSSFIGICGATLRPLCLKCFLESAEAQGASSETHLWLLCLAILLLAEGLAMVNAKMLFYAEVGSGFRAAVGSLLQRKALTVAPGVAGTTSAQGLLGNDVAKLYEQFQWLAQIPYVTFSMLGGFVTLVLTLGFSGIIATVLSLVLLAGTCGSVIFTKRYEATSLKYADKRLQVLLRVVEGIKAVKFNAWEPRFMEQIGEARRLECLYIRRFRLLQELGKGIGRGGPILVPMAAFLYLSLAGYELRASAVFAALTVFESMRAAFVTAPLQLVGINQFLVSTQRIERFLQLPDVAQAATPEPDAVLETERAVFEWYCADVPANGAARFGGAGVELRVRPGEAVAVVGRVGSGKTSLLAGLLGDLRLSSGSLRLSRSVGYAPQRAFIVSGTLCYNVVLGRAWDEALFRKAVAAACLKQDLEDLGGAEVEIGERGVTLSGGQQQRVSVARALYGRPELLILDDPLAAVDAAVARTMFDGIVQRRSEWPTAAGHMAVLMALNQPQFLPYFDNVVTLEDCKISAQGRPEAVMDGAHLTVDDVAVVCDKGTAKSRASKGPNAAQAAAGTSLVAKEKPSVADTLQTLKVYCSFMGCQGVAFLVCAIVGYYLYGATGFLLKMWVDAAEEAQALGQDFAEENMFFCLVFSAVCVVHAVLICASGLFSATATVGSSQELHNDCMRRVLRAPVTWFDATPIGRLSSRFSTDCALVDTLLSIFTEVMVCFACSILALITTISIVAPMTMPVLLVSTVAYCFLCVATDRCNRPVRRQANIANGPVLGLLGEIGFSRGQTVVRVMGLEGHYAARFDARVDEQCRLLYNSAGIVMWATGAAYGLGTFIAAASLLLMLNFGNFSTSEIGLVVTYVFAICFFMQIMTSIVSNFLTFLTALERLLQVHSEVPQEPAWQAAEDLALPAPWPSAGTVEFRSAQLVYRPGLAPALDGVSFVVPGGSSAGVVGRTGSGKSSLMVLLFRIVEASAGQVLLDGVDASKLGLHRLRQAMAIIPQEPLLLEGSVRTNVDPFGERSDEELRAVCARVGLQGGELGTASSELSAGQKQLVCLARTLLQKARIIAFDEPTSNIDPETDKWIQQTMRSEFSGCTRLTIAHRLETIIDCDQIIVMDSGRVMESGAPQVLLADSNSSFAAMARSHGHTVEVGFL